MKPVYILPNGKKLDKKAFCSYLQKKIKKTAKKLGLKSIAMKVKVYCLDDAATEIIYSVMQNKKPSIKKSPFLYCLRKELMLYSKLKNLEFNFMRYRSLKLKVAEMLDKLEPQHPEIKYSIVRAFSQLH